jgi:hypothetical protein
MTKAPDGRGIFVWRGAEDTNRFAEAVAEKLVTALFNVNGQLHWLTDGEPIAVGKNVLHEIITKHFVSVQLASHGPAPEVEYFSFDFPNTPDANKAPNEKALIAMVDMLVGRVAKGPQEPVRLSEQRQQDVRARLKQGERPDRVAEAYGVPVEVVRQLATGQ